jgi:hypothetical protein
MRQRSIGWGAFPDAAIRGPGFDCRAAVRAARPPVEITTLIKHQRTAKAGARYASDFELDHRVPLCLGGAPLDARNLQLQHWGGPWNARCKDALERELCKALCEGLESLEDAQSEMMGDWPGSYRDWIDPKGCEQPLPLGHSIHYVAPKKFTKFLSL